MALIMLLKAATPLAESNGMELPADGLYPYRVEKPLWFWLTYLHQIVLGFFAISAHVGTDTLFVGLLLKAIGQINLLRHRLEKLTVAKEKHVNQNDRQMIVLLIQHHQRIYRYN